MKLCAECKCLPNFSKVMGDGSCEKHGRFAYYESGLKEKCWKCAKEKNICQRCGKEIKSLLKNTN